MVGQPNPRHIELDDLFRTILSQDNPEQQSDSLTLVIHLLTKSIVSADSSLLCQVLERLVISSTLGSPLVAELSHAYIAYYQSMIAANPESAQLYCELGNVYIELKQIEEAIANYQNSILLQPSYTEAHFKLGNAFLNLGDRIEAEKCYLTAISLNPQFVKPYINLAFLQAQQQRFIEAVENLRQAVNLQPNFAEAWANLGGALIQLKEVAEAEACCRQAIAIKPNHATAYLNLGTALVEQGKLESGIACFYQVISLNPNYTSAYRNLAVAFSQQNPPQKNAAIAFYQKALSLEPNSAEILERLIALLLQTGQWKDLESLTQMLWVAIDSQVKTGLPCKVEPLTTSCLPFTAYQQQVTAANYSQDVIRRVSRYKQNLNFSKNRTKSKQEKLRLGYVSADYRIHATVDLIFRLFELHDRECFTVFAYSISPNDGSDYRQKIIVDSDYFRDMWKWEPDAIAQQIYEDEIDILIDLKGYTQLGMPEIFALQPAPLQINYLGYPGTLGAEYMDYIISDRVVISPELSECITEKCIYLPSSYQINQEIFPLPPPSPKSRWGIPEDAFVYCCFNQAVKVEPVIFAAWMRILQQVPNSILWLFQDNSDFETSLKTECTSHDIDSDRLIFAPRLPRQLHLERHQSADLFLDTLYYNAHTTASDSLRAGIPAITVLGETFASRVAASLLTNVGLPELITHNLQEYENLAINLGRNPELVLELKSKLSEQLYTSSLFNPEKTVRYIEEGYRQAWRVYQSGRSPQPIYLEPLKL